VPSRARISPARNAAFDVLLRVEAQNSYATELLHSNLLARLNSSDRGLATELVMGVLRWQQKLDELVEATAGKSIAKFDVEVKLALRLGAYQLLYLDRIPPRAAVNESVEIVKQHGKRSAAPLINAVLRKFSKETLGSSQQDANTPLGTTYSHPAWLVERWMKIYGEEATRATCEYNQKRPRTTIRAASPAVIEELSLEGISVEPATLINAAWHVTAGDVTQTRAYHERRLAIQDEASQLVALLAQGKTILDCCAAPGGKSAIAAEQNPDSMVVSMDLHLQRVRLMRALTGLDTVLTADAARLPFNRQFDCIIADLPCTGTGTLARNPEIKWRLKADDIPRLGQLQFEILSSVAKLAQTIVYSTCSLEPEEGEEVISRFLVQHQAFRLIPIQTRLQQLSQQGSVRNDVISSVAKGKFLRTVPGITSCDGFFAAILETA